MKLKDPKKEGCRLHADRNRMTARCLKVAEKFVPNGYRIIHKQRLSGHVFWKNREFHVPRPVTRKALYIYLHEYAHIYLKHNEADLPIHRREYEAETWAIRMMEYEDIPPPFKMIQQGKAYVLNEIIKALAHGEMKICKSSWKYATTPRWTGHINDPNYIRLTVDNITEMQIVVNKMIDYHYEKGAFKNKERGKL